MRFMKRYTIVSALVLALICLASPLSYAGDEWNLTTRFTLNREFEVPGAILDANTPYVIRLLPSPVERDVVQVFNDDQSKLLTEFIAIRTERTNKEDKTMFTFLETGPGHPVPIHQWYYPGRITGREFIYPHDQALRIAGYTKTTIVMPTAVAAVVQETIVTEPEAVAEVEPAVEPEVQIAQAEPAEQQVEREDENVAEQPAAEQPALIASNETPTRELPKTASDLPLTGLIGFIGVGLGLALKAFTTRNS